MKQLSISILIAFALLFCGCHSTGSAATPTPTVPEKPSKSEAAAPVQSPSEPTAVSPPVSQTGQLIGHAADADAAQEIADLYGITLVDYAYGLALFNTDEDPMDVIQRGSENGWPELTPNISYTAN